MRARVHRDPSTPPNPRGGIREGGFRVVAARISNPVIPNPVMSGGPVISNSVELA